MKKAIYYRLILLTIIAILICSFISAFIHAVNTETQTEEWLTKLTLSTAENYSNTNDVYALSETAGNTRVTIIAPNGKVLADSETNIAQMENHSEREEVKYAETGSVYIVVRTSESLGQKYMYASIKTEGGNILRLAHSYPGLLNNLIAQFPAMLVAILAALVLSLYLAGRFSKAVISPLEKVVDALSAQEYGALGSYSSSYYEIDKIMRSMQMLLQKIEDSNQKLRDESEKVDCVLSNMAEGFILIDSQKNVLLCNNSARDFFSCSSDVNVEKMYQLTRNLNVTNAMQSALDHGQSSIFDLELKEGLIANIYISPSKITESEFGATVLIVDMTAERQLEQQKRDFFSNASHELKTPITSILGFSEMMNNGIVKSSGEKAEIIKRIEIEAKRLSELINDILTISKLESNSANTEYSEFNFGDVVKEAVDSVLPFKENTEIEFETNIDDVLYRANKRQIGELCVNLVENAVKYNKPNGKVSVSLKSTDSQIILTVKDTGIGISPEHQVRVFERFYRVDYGRDKKIGGTGLGLSIVKHIVSLYGGTITLQSKKDVGTEIAVSLPLVVDSN